MTSGFEITRVCAFLLISVMLSGCNPTSVTLGGELGVRELRPPKQGINVGALYYVRENSDLNTPEIERDPAKLEKLCEFDISRAGIALDTVGDEVSDVDILQKYLAQGQLSASSQLAASLGVSGKLDRYFSFVLTNAREVSISSVDADNIFSSQAFLEKCRGWRANIENNNWSAYQITAITIGDLVFSRNAVRNLDATLEANLRQVEASIQLELSTTLRTKFSGSGLVVGFNSIVRQ